MAERAEISSKFLYEVEKGRKGLSADTLLKICRELSCSCDYILTGKTRIEENDEQLVRLVQDFTEKDRAYAVKLLALVQEMHGKNERAKKATVFEGSKGSESIVGVTFV